MICDDCIRHCVCGLVPPKDNKTCKYFLNKKRIIISPLPIGTEIFHLEKQKSEKTTIINGKEYRYDEEEWIVGKSIWTRFDAVDYGEEWEEEWMDKIYLNLEEAEKECKKRNEELKNEN